MAIHVVPDKVRTIWNEEEIRIAVMASLLLQILLIFLAPLRKRVGSKLLAYALWSFYLAADYMATFALGNILSGQITFEYITQSASLDAELLAFWAPFLLLHLGGPDTITSYSVEDNELWFRHFLGLALQVSIVFLVLLYSSFSSRLLLAGTLLVFLAGFIKFAERIRALCLASNKSLEETFLSIPMQAHSDFSDVHPTEPVIISMAFTFFVSQINSVFGTKPFEVDAFLLPFNQKCDGEEAFHVVEIEASFLHDILHTKASCLRALHGVAWRCGTLVMVMNAFLLFHLCEKQGYKKINVIITYILVCMGVLLEVISVLTMIVSDWTIAFLERKGHKKLARAICNVVQCAFGLGRPKPRWTNQIEQYNQIRVFIKLLHRRPILRRLLRYFSLEDDWDRFWYVDHVEIEAGMKDLIIQSLRIGADKREPDYLKHKLYTIYKPEHPISESQWLNFQDIYYNLPWVSTGMDSTERLIKWHIVTELCYNVTNAGEREDEREYENRFKLIGYHLSNYMMNWFGKDSMVSNYIQRQSITRFKQSVFVRLKEVLEGQSITEVEACHRLFNIPLGNTNCVFSEASSIARRLNTMDVGLRWRMICMIWVDLLVNRVNAIKLEKIWLRNEGNLTMLVWFLINHHMPPQSINTE